MVKKLLKQMRPVKDLNKPNFNTKLCELNGLQSDDNDYLD